MMFSLHSHLSSSTFFGLNCNLIFLILIPKFQVQFYYILAVIAENVTISGIPILIYLNIFITATFPVSRSCIFPRREKEKQSWG